MCGLNLLFALWLASSPTEKQQHTLKRATAAPTPKLWPFRTFSCLLWARHHISCEERVKYVCGSVQPFVSWRAAFLLDKNRRDMGTSVKVGGMNDES